MARGGKLIGLGVGPGDPELLTLRAARVLKGVPAIAFIAAAGRASRAREVAGPHIRAGTRELIAVVPMTGDQAATDRAYGQLVAGIGGELGRGNDVAYLCEGDPLLHGSFVHVMRRLPEGFACEVVPGITSMTAAAGAALTPLAMGDEPLAVVPATLPPERLAAALREADRAVILKVGRHLDRAREALAAAGMLEGAVLVENVTLVQQRVRPLAAVGDAQAPYFSLILAGRQGDSA